MTLVVYAVLAAVAGTSWAPATLRRRILYIAAGVMVFATVLNIASPSLIERIIWVPVTIVLVLALWHAARHESISPVSRQEEIAA